MAKEPTTQFASNIKLNQAKQLQVSGCTDPGQYKAINEDSFATFQLQLPPSANESSAQSIYVAVVADGVTETKNGEVASRIAVETVKNCLSQLPMPIHQWIASTIKDAHRLILNNAQRHPELKGMCSTMILAVIQDATLYLGYVGDSYVYLLRNGKSYQLTIPHNEGQERIDRGEKGDSPKVGASAITRHVGNKQNISVDLEIVNIEEPDFLCLPRLQRNPLKSLPLKPGDSILLCSDGLTKAVKKMATILHTVEQLSTEDAVYELIRKANANGAKDNVTAILMQYPTVQLNNRGFSLNKNQRSLSFSMLTFIVLCLAVLASFRLFSSWNEGVTFPTATPQVAINLPFTETPAETTDIIVTASNIVVVSQTTETANASSIEIGALTSTPTLAPPPPSPTLEPSNTPAPVFLAPPTNTPKLVDLPKSAKEDSGSPIDQGTMITDNLTMTETNTLTDTLSMSCVLEQPENGNRIDRFNKIDFKWNCDRQLQQNETFVIKIGPEPSIEKITCDLYGVSDQGKLEQESSNDRFRYTRSVFDGLPKDLFDLSMEKHNCLTSTKGAYWAVYICLLGETRNCDVQNSRNVVSETFLFNTQ